MAPEDNRRMLPYAAIGALTAAFSIWLNLAEPFSHTTMIVLGVVRFVIIAFCIVMVGRIYLAARRRP